MNVIVLLNGNVYKMTRRRAKDLIRIAKEKYESENKNIIVAIERGMQFEMRRDEYKTFRELENTMMQLNKKGFLVHYTKQK